MTLHKYRVIYKDQDDPGCPEFSCIIRGHNLEDARFRFFDTEDGDGGWEILRIERVPEKNPKKSPSRKVVTLEFDTASHYRRFRQLGPRVGVPVEGGWEVPSDSAYFYQALEAFGGWVVDSGCPCRDCTDPSSPVPPWACQKKNPPGKDKKISGYSNCPCRDCFEVAMDGSLCNLCEDAGCDKTGRSECSRDPEENGSESEEETSQCSCGERTSSRCQNIASFPGPNGKCPECRRQGCTKTSKCEVQEDNMEAQDKRNPAEDKAWKTISYGVMPTKKDFSYHWDAHMDARLYKIEANNARGLIRAYEGEYTEQQLWDVITNLIKNFEGGDDEAGDLASAILGTLGFEWV